MFCLLIIGLCYFYFAERAIILEGCICAVIWMGLGTNGAEQLYGHEGLDLMDIHPAITSI